MLNAGQGTGNFLRLNQTQPYLLHVFLLFTLEFLVIHTENLFFVIDFPHMHAGCDRKGIYENVNINSEV